MNNIIIFGDSNVHFLSFFHEKISENDVNATTVEGFKKDCIHESNVSFLWKYRASASKFNGKYLLEKIKNNNIDISDTSSIVFQFGHNDLCNIEYSLQVEEIFKKYINDAYIFSKENGIIPIFTTPVAPLKYVNSDNLELCIKVMSSFCNDLNIKLINIYDVIPLNYSSESWDPHLHLDKMWSNIMLEYILKQIKENE